MSSFAHAAAAAMSSFIRRCRGQYFHGGISSSSSCTLLWRRTISSNSPNPNPNHQQCPAAADPNNPNLTKQEAPWLLLSSYKSGYLYGLTIGSDADKETEYFYNQFNRKLYVPDIQEQFVIGSSEGFLISVSMTAAPFGEKIATICAFNPLTGSQLIPVTNLPHLFSYYWSDARRDASLSAGKPPLLRFYRTKLILSPTLDTIVIVSNPVGSHCPHFALLPFSSSSSSPLNWTELSYFGDWSEGIFHKGRLHATTNYHGDLYMFENLKSNNRSAGYMFENLKSNRLATGPMVTKHFLQNSLVESPDGDELFLVYRSIDDSGDGTWNDDPYPCHLISVYKLRFNQKKKRYEWEQAKSIGDLAFFVGAKSSSLSLDVSDRHLFPSLKPNSVYFSDTWSVQEDSLDPERLGKPGVYTLEHKTFHSIHLIGYHGHIDWAPPMWYTPVAPAMQD